MADEQSSDTPTRPFQDPNPRRAAEPSVHKIVLVGGGAAGLQLATKLGDRLGRRNEAQVTLVDRSRTHIWKPLLHEVAAGSLDVGHHAVDYLAQAHRHHFRYRIGEMLALDRDKQEVYLAASFDNEGREVTPPRSFPYDTLVMAVGSGSNDFGTRA
jgi:NADH:ubiquinone reductase (H+-translocating)